MKSKNLRLQKGFGQVSNEVMRNPELSLKDKGLYAYLCTFAGSETNELIVSVYRMADECGTSPSSIKRSIDTLVSMGIIDRLFMGKGNTRKTIILK
jgi:DNA-binding MarR family transcriptional regulator